MDTIEPESVFGDDGPMTCRIGVEAVEDGVEGTAAIHLIDPDQPDPDRSVYLHPVDAARLGERLISSAQIIERRREAVLDGR